MKFVVLAGGKGTRFFPVTQITPKCLVNVAGKPCVRWIIEDAMEQGFEDLILCINKEHERSFKHEFRDLKDTITFSISEEALGTVSEIMHTKKIIGVDTIIMRYGDDLTEIDYKTLLKFHNERPDYPVTLVVTTELELPVGIIEMATPIRAEGYARYNRVAKILEKPKLGKPSWVGACVMDMTKVEPYLELYDDFARDTFPKMLEAGERIGAFDTKSEWFDVGNVQHWAKADEYFRRHK